MLWSLCTDRIASISNPFRLLLLKAQVFFVTVAAALGVACSPLCAVAVQEAVDCLRVVHCDSCVGLARRLGVARKSLGQARAVAYIVRQRNGLRSMLRLCFLHDGLMMEGQLSQSILGVG